MRMPLERFVQICPGYCHNTPIAADGFSRIERSKISPSALARVKFVAHQLSVINIRDNVISGDCNARTTLDWIGFRQHRDAICADLAVNSVAKAVLSTWTFELLHPRGRWWRRGAWNWFMLRTL